MKYKILPVFISFAGCTSKCIYCNQSLITGITPANVINSAKKQIDEHLASADWDELAFYGGSFTCLPRDIRLALYGLARESGIKALRFSTSPDCISEEILDEALENGVKVIELGVQSLDGKVLLMNKRPYTADECLNSFQMVRNRVNTAGIQIMAGLFGEDFESFAYTIDKVVGMKADYARIYPCVVLEDTELAELYRKGEYTPLTLQEAVSRCAYGYIMLTAAGCNVIRMGLQDSPSVKDSAIAGAYHPAIGEMAKTVALLTFLNMGGKIGVAQRYLNVAYGYGGIVKKMFRDKVEIKEGAMPDFIEIAKFIARGTDEDHKRKIQEQTAYFAERLISETNHR